MGPKVTRSDWSKPGDINPLPGNWTENLQAPFSSALISSPLVSNSRRLESPGNPLLVSGQLPTPQERSGSIAQPGFRSPDACHQASPVSLPVS